MYWMNQFQPYLYLNLFLIMENSPTSQIGLEGYKNLSLKNIQEYLTTFNFLDVQRPLANETCWWRKQLDLIFFMTTMCKYLLGYMFTFLQEPSKVEKRGQASK